MRISSPSANKDGFDVRETVLVQLQRPAHSLATFDMLWQVLNRCGYGPWSSNSLYWEVWSIGVRTVEEIEMVRLHSIFDEGLELRKW